MPATILLRLLRRRHRRVGSQPAVLTTVVHHEPLICTSAWVRARIVHLEWVEDVFLDVFVERHAGDRFDDKAEPVSVDAVGVFGTGVEAERCDEVLHGADAGVDGLWLFDVVAPIEGVLIQKSRR